MSEEIQMNSENRADAPFQPASDLAGGTQHRPAAQQPGVNHYQPPYQVPQPAQSPLYYPPERQKKKRRCGALIAVALCCSLVGSALGAGGVLLANHLMADEEAEKVLDASAETEESNVSNMFLGSRESAVIDITTIDTGAQMTPAEVYAANVNSTVGITTSITTNYWGYQTTSAASGSGFIITDDGYILTNYHVIEDSDSISVSMYDGTSYDAELIGYDKSNDIAVLKIEAEGLAPVILGDSDNLNVGDSVVAIGNPLGELTFSLTAGAVSAMNREVTLSSSVTMDLIQTDCAINSGNSGGALFNLYGEVIGITNAKYSSGSGEASIDNIGFAIPVNDILPIVESIIENGYISKPYMGVSISDVSAEAQAYGIPEGAAVQSVTEDSPAQKAGLQVGDVITHVDGEVVTGSAQVVELVGASRVGDTLVMTVYRQGQTLELTVTIEEQIQSATAEEETSGQQYQQMQPGSSPFGSGRY